MSDRTDGRNVGFSVLAAFSMPAVKFRTLKRLAGVIGVVSLLLGLTSAAKADPWLAGGSFCSFVITSGPTPQSAVEQFIATIRACDPPEYNEYFLYCDPPVFGRNGETGLVDRAGVNCYTHRFIFGVDAALLTGAGKVCRRGFVMDQAALDCICPDPQVEFNGQCVFPPCPASAPYLQGGKCYPNPPKIQGPPRSPSCCQANPVDAGTGNKYQVEPVYREPNLGALEVTLSYNGYNAYTDLTDAWAGPFGRNWIGRYFAVIKNQRKNTISVRRPSGAELEFRPPTSGAFYLTDADTPDTLEQLLNGSTPVGWRYTTSSGDEAELYDAAGRLLSISSRSGLVTRLTYSDGSNGFLYPEGSTDPATAGPLGFRSPACQIAYPLPPVGTVLSAGHLLCATDAFGRQVHLEYIDPTANAFDGLGRVHRVLDPAGQAYTFEYDGPSGPAGANNLTRITFPDNRTRVYHYNEPAQINNGTACTGLPAGLPNSLTGITDENGNRFASWTYDCQGRATSSQHAGGADLYVFNYGSGSTAVADPLGTSRTIGLQGILGITYATGTSQPAASGSGTTSDSLTYDGNGNIASRTDFNGHVTTYGYDLARNLETSRTEAFGTPQARTISTQWHPTFRLPARVAEPLRITTYLYNGDGVSCGVMADGTTLVPGVLCSKTVQATSDATGAAGFGATPVGSPRTWRYVYNQNGSVLAVDGPRTDVADVTSYAYYANDDADLGKRGNLASVTNALGFVTQILAYNAHGQPLTIVDPNGLTTTLGYDPRQRLTSRDVGGETTIYTYDNVGQLTRVTLPDTSFLSYGYDAAHRLTSISDNLGNSIAYTLDPMGNRTREDVRDPGGSLAQTRSRVYDPLNRLFQDIGAQSQTTQYGYDNQGNLTSIDGPLSGAVDVTINGYDALNRLVRVTDPASGVTQYAYDGLDQLASVTDPRNLVTAYGYDGLANLNAQASPDTGNTVNTYDAAGNLLTQTDAKGQVTRYAYDALNRVTSITFDDGSAQNYGYDQGSNGLGRLTFFAETNPQNQITILQDYAYDAHGRTITENRTLSGVTYVMRYRYDAAGRLFGLTYPSGRTVDYGFDALGRIGSVSTTPASGGATQVVASDIAYQPFGGAKSWTLGNGQTYSRGYDTDGRISSYGTAAQSFALGYDPAGRIFSITDSANSANPASYGYDSLDRLTSATTAGGDFGYSYDAVGNRLTKTTAAGTDTYTYSPTSNRLLSIAGTSSRSFGYDLNGSTLNDGVKQYAYDARGRMVQSVNEPGLATAYQVNALGQRVRKTNPSDDRVFLYDTRGHLIAETTPTGALLREYVYLNDIPLAVIQ
jgi:YD repeat-containing protein